VADPLYRVELTASFLERLDAIEAFLVEADAGFAFDDLLAELRATVIPNLRRFPRIGRRYLANPPQSAEALAQLAALPAGAPDALREYLHGDYLMLYTVVDASPSQASVYLLSIRHHRQLSFDFAKLWSRLGGQMPHSPSASNAVSPTAASSSLVARFDAASSAVQTTSSIYRRDFPLAVVEAKEAGLPAENGVQQAREYAEAWGSSLRTPRTATASSRSTTLAGTEREVERYATSRRTVRPADGRRRPCPKTPRRICLEPFNLASGKVPRYYQQIAINRVVEAVSARPEAHPSHAGHRHGQDLRGLPDLLEALEQPLEPHGRTPTPEDSVSWPTATCPGRRPDGQDVRALR
jgi:hypothetical protein